LSQTSSRYLGKLGRLQPRDRSLQGQSQFPVVFARQLWLYTPQTAHFKCFSKIEMSRVQAYAAPMIHGTASRAPGFTPRAETIPDRFPLQLDVGFVIHEAINRQVCLGHVTTQRVLYNLLSGCVNYFHWSSPLLPHLCHPMRRALLRRVLQASHSAVGAIQVTS
jgi:hypothetical protein